jgi:hypothetical protein
MSEHRILRLKPALRLERRGQHGQNKTEQPDHSASLGDSIRSSTQIRFSVHTTVDSKLKRLIKTGIITLDGERYRYNPQRPLTPDEERQFDDIQRAFDKLSPVLKKLKAPLDS